MKNKYAILDIFKLFFAICVVFIHTELFLKIKYGFYIHQMIFRLAVPFFFVCSGYLLSKKKNDKKRLKNSLKQNLKIYIVWSIIYLIANYFYYNLNYIQIMESIKRLLLLSTDSVMWFIGSMIFSIIVLYFLKNNNKYILLSILVSFILFLIGLSFTTYNFIPRNIEIRTISNNLQAIFWNCRNPIFSGYLYYSIGYYIGLNQYKMKLNKNIIFLILSVILLWIETFIIKNHLNEIIQYEFLLMHIPTIIFLFLLLIKIKIKFNSIFIRKISTYIFYFHILIIYSYRKLIFHNVINLKTDNIILDILVLLTSIIIASLFYCIKTIYDKIKLKEEK